MGATDCPLPVGRREASTWLFDGFLSGGTGDARRAMESEEESVECISESVVLVLAENLLISSAMS